MTPGTTGCEGGHYIFEVMPSLQLQCITIETVLCITVPPEHGRKIDAQPLFQYMGRGKTYAPCGKITRQRKYLGVIAIQYHQVRRTLIGKYPLLRLHVA